jgi:hypothetical protein
MFNVDIPITNDSDTDLAIVCDEIINQNGLKNNLTNYKIDNVNITITLTFE